MKLFPYLFIQPTDVNQTGYASPLELWIKGTKISQLTGYGGRSTSKKNCQFLNSWVARFGTLERNAAIEIERKD